MQLIVCIDKNGGLMFNRRRMSRDRVLNEKILQTVGETPLWMTSYSAPLFADFASSAVRVAEDCLSAAGRDDWCFWEGSAALIPWDKVQTLHVICWNRAYPSDTRFPKDVLRGKRPQSKIEFAGSSHEKITWEVYAL